MKVAVYGSLRQGMHNHHLLEKESFLGKEVVYGFKMYNLGSFPACVPEKTKSMIVTEIYEVSDKTFNSLDRLEGYPNFYDRTSIVTKFGLAWIYYLHNPMHKNSLVKCGDWVKYKEQL
jgi:gamma-glutamylcyclotransferase (GGCT)/AIG2-like uncharacterized protein YtfP